MIIETPQWQLWLEESRSCHLQLKIHFWRALSASVWWWQADLLGWMARPLTNIGLRLYFEMLRFSTQLYVLPNHNFVGFEIMSKNMLLIFWKPFLHHSIQTQDGCSAIANLSTRLRKVVFKNDFAAFCPIISRIKCYDVSCVFGVAITCDVGSTGTLWRLHRDGKQTSCHL